MCADHGFFIPLWDADILYPQVTFLPFIVIDIPVDMQVREQYLPLPLVMSDGLL